MTHPGKALRTKVVEVVIDDEPGKVHRFASEDEAWAHVLWLYPEAAVRELFDDLGNELAWFFVPMPDAGDAWMPDDEFWVSVGMIAVLPALAYKPTPGD